MSQPASFSKNGSARFYVYVYWNPLKDGTPPFYVGKGQGFRARSHLCPSGGDGKNKYKEALVKEIRRAGMEPLITYEWCGNDEQEALLWERFLIELFGKRRNGGLLANLTDGGEGTSGFKLAPELVKRLADARRGKPKRFPVSEETCRRLSASLKGHAVSSDTRKKISERQTGTQRARGHVVSQECRDRIAEKLKGRPGIKGVVRSEEWRLRLSKSHEGKKHSPESIAKMKGNQNALGYRHSDEVKAEISARQKGRTLSEGHKAKIRASSGGWHHTEESRRKMSEARRRRAQSESAGTIIPATE
jgi:hypothetical protein